MKYGYDAICDGPGAAPFASSDQRLREEQPPEWIQQDSYYERPLTPEVLRRLNAAAPRPSYLRETATKQACFGRARESAKEAPAAEARQVRRFDELESDRIALAIGCEILGGITLSEGRHESMESLANQVREGRTR